MAILVEIEVNNLGKCKDDFVLIKPNERTTENREDRQTDGSRGLWPLLADPL